jgi:sugar lactone lactonase YvrE
MAAISPARTPDKWSNTSETAPRPARNGRDIEEESTMWHGRAMACALGVAIAATIAVTPEPGFTETVYGANDAPNPYKYDYGWAKLPDGRKWGAAVGVAIDRDGKSVWVFDRCESATDCSKSKLDPIMKFDSTGKMVKSFGGGLINYSHGLHIDPDNNVWVTDGRAMDNGKGHTVMKFSQDGKLLMTLGKPGVAGTIQDTFNAPSDVLVAPNGDIFVADGHGGDTNNRIVKFNKDGKYIKEWGKKGTGPGEFNVPHRLAMDSAGRLFVADRSNNRIQAFDQDGKYLLEWRQFGSPSGLFIDRNDILYVADNSPDDHNPPYRSGIRAGSEGRDRHSFHPGGRRGLRRRSRRRGRRRQRVWRLHQHAQSPAVGEEAGRGGAGGGAGTKPRSGRLRPQ